MASTARTPPFTEPANTSDVDVILAAVRLAHGEVEAATPVDFQLLIVLELLERLERLRAKVEGGNATAELTLI